MADACAVGEYPYALVRLEVPGTFEPEDFPLPDEGGSRGEIALLPWGFQVGLENHLLLRWSHLKDQLGKPLAKLLRHPPEGSTLECAFGRAEEPASCQRYCGTIHADTWRITATHPPLTPAVLREALQLAAHAEHTQHKALHEAEAAAVMQAVERDDYLYNMGVTQKGLTISCAYDAGHLAKLFFRQRFRDSWDVAAVEAHVEKAYQERIHRAKEMRRAMVEAAKRRAAPHEETVCYEGKKTRFWRADFAQLTELDQTQREQFDKAMREKAYRHLGDMVAKKFRDIVIRCYGSADGLVYALLMGKRAFYMGHECISLFADGSRLTTTTNATVDSHPEIKVYYKLCPGMEPGPLEEKHRWGINRFRTHRHTEPVPLEMSLLGVAKAMDEAIAREEQRQEQEKQRQQVEQIAMEED
jgi:hypothetical protein